MSRPRVDGTTAGSLAVAARTWSLADQTGSAVRAAGGRGGRSGSRSNGLAVAQTVVVAIRRHRAVVSRLRCPSSS